MSYKFHSFPNLGVLFNKFTNDELEPVRAEINEIQQDFGKSKKRNSDLAGNIKNEFALTKSVDYLEKLVLPFVITYDKEYDYLKRTSILTKDLPMVLDTPWVNFQQKHEFNPPHNHSGVMSFVIWMSIPYSIEEESIKGPGAESLHPVAGYFSFHFTNIIGQIDNEPIPVDRQMENVMALFPSSLNHSVFPFYTSDKYRISVSGNFKLKVS
jgi:hypothetical protein